MSRHGQIMNIVKSTLGPEGQQLDIQSQFHQHQFHMHPPHIKVFHLFLYNISHLFLSTPNLD
jgi:hypothetical protein